MNIETWNTINEDAVVRHSNGKEYVAYDVRVVVEGGDKLIRFKRLLNGKPSGLALHLSREQLTLVKNGPEPVRTFEDRVDDGEYDLTPEQRKLAPAARKVAGQALDDKFKADLFRNFSVTSTPKTERAYELAVGFTEERFMAVNLFREIVELLKP